MEAQVINLNPVLISHPNKQRQINALDWWREQPKGVWLNVCDIPSAIFWSIWDVQIEKSNVELHPTEAKYKIHRYNFYD